MAVPADPRDYDKLDFATGNAAVFGGSPGEGTMYKRRLVYPADAYIVDTDAPQIRSFDGITDRGIASIPNDEDGNICKAIVSMIAANGTVYLTTLDSGTNDTDWEGRVFQFDPDSGDLTALGLPFSGGHIPYALAWHMGRLWVGTNKGNGDPGTVWFFRPGIDTTWTLDHTNAAGSVCAMLSFQGNLYVGVDAVAATFGKVLVRDDAGAYTTSDTGSGGSATVNNGYYSLCEFNGKLYAGYFNNDTPKIARIREFDGATWSTVYTGATTTLIPFVQMFVDTGTLYVIGGSLLIQAVLLSTVDGVSYTDLSANLAGPATGLPLHGVLVI